MSFHRKNQIKIQIFSKAMAILVSCGISENKAICYGTTSLGVIYPKYKHITYNLYLWDKIYINKLYSKKYFHIIYQKILKITTINVIFSFMRYPCFCNQERCDRFYYIPNEVQAQMGSLHTHKWFSKADQRGFFSLEHNKLYRFW